MKGHFFKVVGFCSVIVVSCSNHAFPSAVLPQVRGFTLTTTLWFTRAIISEDGQKIFTRRADALMALDTLGQIIWQVPTPTDTSTAIDIAKGGRSIFMTLIPSPSALSGCPDDYPDHLYDGETGEVLLTYTDLQKLGYHLAKGAVSDDGEYVLIYMEEGGKREDGDCAAIEGGNWVVRYYRRDKTFLWEQPFFKPGRDVHPNDMAVSTHGNFVLHGGLVYNRNGQVVFDAVASGVEATTNTGKFSRDEQYLVLHYVDFTPHPASHLRLMKTDGTLIWDKREHAVKLAIDGVGERVAVANNKGLKVFDRAGNQIYHFRPPEPWVWGWVDISQTGSILLGCGEPPRQYTYPNNPGDPVSVTPSIATYYLIHIDSGQVLWQENSPGDAGWCQVFISADGTRFVIRGENFIKFVDASDIVPIGGRQSGRGTAPPTN